MQFVRSTTDHLHDPPQARPPGPVPTHSIYHRMNRYFLCKFLKDTLLQSKTYLFCAIRPEVEYLKYTFATLGFAKNASVVQLAPKKATTA